ncbi:carbohydrate ABC transporter permease [Cohnella cellulosilytica]|uniref:Carbohydrate ABC transporter permease n=1 Tax=Cohnella cellulosilytica TaxID=986710 RepID=A0ABW2FH94_9BACL
MKPSKSDHLWGYLFIAPQLVGLIVFALLPVAFGFAIGFLKWDGFGSAEFVGFDNFAFLYQDELFRTALVNTAYYTLIALPFGLALALSVALALNKVAGRMIYRVIYYMPGITSTVVVAIVWLWVLNPDFGLINAYLKDWFGIDGPRWFQDPILAMPLIAVVVAWQSLGGTMLLYLAGLQGISATYYEAAELDGATKWGKLRHITLPLLTPTIFFTVILGIIGSFQVFDQTYILTNGGPYRATYTVLMYIYNAAFVDVIWGKSSAAAIVLFFILLVFTLIQLKYSKRWVHYGN